MSAQQEPRLRDLSAGNWYRVHNEFMDSIAPSVGVFAVAVYHVLCRYARNERITGLTADRMALILSCGRTAVFEALRVLERKGAIRRVRRAGIAEYELLELRSATNAHSHRSKAIEACQSATRTDSVRHTDETGSRGERPIRKERLKDSKTPIPLPPFQGGEARTISDQEAERCGQEFKCALKRELYDVPPNAAHLATDDYDRYFRDVNFIGTGEGPIIVETADLEVTNEGLHKYKTRLAKIGRRVFEREVEFEIVYEGAAE